MVMLELMAAPVLTSTVPSLKGTTWKAGLMLMNVLVTEAACGHAGGARAEPLDWCASAGRVAPWQAARGVRGPQRVRGRREREAAEKEGSPALAPGAVHQVRVEVRVQQNRAPAAHPRVLLALDGGRRPDARDGLGDGPLGAHEDLRGAAQAQHAHGGGR